MKKIKIYLLLVIILIFTACQESPNNENETKNTFDIIDLVTGNISLDNTQGTISIEADGIANSTQVAFQTNSSIFSSNSRTTKVDAGTVLVNGIMLTKDENNEYYNEDSQSTAFGISTSFSISGNSSSGIDQFSESIYIPELIDMQVSNGSSHNKLLDLTVTWNKDINNPLEVYLRLDYNLAYNKMLDSNMTAPSVSKVYLVADNGSYTISSSDFADMPVGARIEVAIARGNYSISGTTQKHLVYAVSTDSKMMWLTN